MIYTYTNNIIGSSLNKKEVEKVKQKLEEREYKNYERDNHMLEIKIERMIEGI